MEGAEEGTVWDCGSHRYVLQKVVGNGAFGIVWRAQREDGETVAIKKVLLDRRYHNRELQMMKVVEHENIIRLRHFFEKSGRKKDETYLHLVMDYLPETLRSVVLQHHKRRKSFHPDHVRAYLWQTFSALEYIHSQQICHRDIKPDNVLVDPSTLKCRLCDFGCSKVPPGGLKLVSPVGPHSLPRGGNQHGSDGYADPAVARCGGCGSPCGRCRGFTCDHVGACWHSGAGIGAGRQGRGAVLS